MTKRYSQSAHATWKQAPMKPANEIMRIMKPRNKSGVWRNFSHVVLLLAIHNPAPIIGIDANSVKRFKKPITVLLNLYMFF